MAGQQHPVTPNDLPNIQGDIVVGFSKKSEKFFFFTIVDERVDDFRAQLSRILPFVTSAARAKHDQGKIMRHKMARAPGLLDVDNMNIAFSMTGLNKMGFGKAGTSDSIGDKSFEQGMKRNAESILGDNLKNWLPGFQQPIDGVILIAGNSHERIEMELAEIKFILRAGQRNATIREVMSIVGDVRPYPHSGHEHFGYLDGVSQPKIDGIDAPGPAPSETPVAPGHFLIGRPGDSKAEDRPDWAKDGSILCFRQLAQRVPEFDAFKARNAATLPPGTPTPPKFDAAELIGARMVGRWKSGAPIDNPHFTLVDDGSMSKNDPNINNFAFSGDGNAVGGADKNKIPDRCPWAGHIRKTNPRDDLSEAVGFDPKTFLDPHRLLRRGIPFGPEVTPLEKAHQKTINSRGLLFVCYQSFVPNGFEFVQQSWANAPGFIFGKKDKSNKPLLPGFDPVVGQNTDNAARESLGLNPGNKTANVILKLDSDTEEWVVSNGGEYFFSPTISTLRDRFASPASRPPPAHAPTSGTANGHP